MRKCKWIAGVVLLTFVMASCGGNAKPSAPVDVSATIAAGVEATIQAIPTATPALQTTPIPTDSPSPTPTPTPTSTPRPTPTPRPTATPTPTPEPIVVDGRGDSVLTCTLSTGRHRMKVSHSGSSNFTVWIHGDEGGSDLLVNEIGRYDGTVLIEVGTGFLAIAPGGCIIEISADGRWRLELLD